MPLNEPNTAIVGSSKVPKAHDEPLELRVLAILKQNPRLTQQELSKQLAIPLATIKRTMMGMVEKSTLVRKDGKRYGYWEINTK